MLVVLSDLHFGLEFCTLRDDALADRLIGEIAALAPEEIVLLGDVFDFWDSEPEVAMGESRRFLEKLSGLGARIVYVPGNHDHHAKVMDSESGLYGSGVEPALPYVLRSPFFAHLLRGTNVEVRYHEYEKTIGSRKFLFTHGHFFIGENSLVPQVLRELGVLRSRIRSSVERLKQREIDEMGLERVLTEAYETLYWTTFFGGLKGSLSQAWYGAERLFLRVFGMEPLDAYFTRTCTEVERYLNGRVFDYVVFGHSHRAGIYSGITPFALVNTGAWCTAGTYEPDALNCYAVIDGSGVKLRRLR